MMEVVVKHMGIADRLKMLVKASVNWPACI